VERFHFLASTLSTPQFGQSPPMPSSAFAALCARSLSPGEAADLAGTSLDPPSGVELGARTDRLIDRYWFREGVLRNELCRLRAQAIGTEPAKYLRPLSVQIAEMEPIQTALRAFQAADPLAGEMELERSRWKWLDLEAALHAFDLDALYAYMLRLLILERIGSFREETGAAEYESTYKTVLDGRGARSGS
jgi:hypothetical protein